MARLVEISICVDVFSCMVSLFCFQGPPGLQGPQGPQGDMGLPVGDIFNLCFDGILS